MKVLIACEFSGIVRDAFIGEGHDAISCDLLPTERPGPHIQGDVTALLEQRWDLVIAHPPCRYLAQSGIAEVKRNPYRRLRGMVGAIRLFRAALEANAPLVAVENPKMLTLAKRRCGEPSFYCQPHQFGDPYLKLTYWWVKGLPVLLPTNSGWQDTLPSLVDGSGTVKRRKGLYRDSRSMGRRRPWQGNLGDPRCA